MGELANAARGSTPDRDLAALALDIGGWQMERAQEIGGNPDEALASLKAMLVPAKDVEPNGAAPGTRHRGPKTDRLVKALALIGAKIAPTMAEEQMQAWIAAMTKALSDLPFAFAQRGAEAAIHTPMKFLNEVESVVREKANDARARHSVAMHRLRLFRDQIERAGEPALPPPAYEEQDPNELHPAAKKLGLSAGWLFEAEDGRLEWAGKDDEDD